MALRSLARKYRRRQLHKIMNCISSWMSSIGISSPIHALNNFCSRFFMNIGGRCSPYMKSVSEFGIVAIRGRSLPFAAILYGCDVSYSPVCHTPARFVQCAAKATVSSIRQPNHTNWPLKSHEFQPCLRGKFTAFATAIGISILADRPGDVPGRILKTERPGTARSWSLHTRCIVPFYNDAQPRASSPLLSATLHLHLHSKERWHWCHWIG